VTSAPTYPLYIFIDESGNFDFTLSGTRFFTLTAVITHTPWEKVEEITKVRHLILSGDLLPGLRIDYLEERLCHHFHATEDKQPVRDQLFNIIQQIRGFKAHSIVVQKNKANPSIRDAQKFYPMMVGFLLGYIFKTYAYSKLCIFIDGIPIKRQKDAFIGAIKSEIKNKQPKQPFVIYFPNAASNCFLQISDYVNWAIFRKWEKGDTRSYDLIKSSLGRPEFDVFSRGATYYY